MLIFSVGNVHLKKGNIFSYDAELQINKVTMVQFLDMCVPDSRSGLSAEVFDMRQLMHNRQHKLKRDLFA